MNELVVRQSRAHDSDWLGLPGIMWILSHTSHH